MTCPHVNRAEDVTGGAGPAIVLDPFVSDLNAESAALRAAGPLARVELPGGVACYAVTHHAEARRLLNDTRVVKDINVWGAWQRGEIPLDWPLIGLANPGRSMLTVDGVGAPAAAHAGRAGADRAPRRAAARAASRS